MEETYLVCLFPLQVTSLAARPPHYPSSPLSFSGWLATFFEMGRACPSCQHKHFLVFHFLIPPLSGWEQGETTGNNVKKKKTLGLHESLQMRCGCSLNTRGRPWAHPRPDWFLSHVKITVMMVHVQYGLQTHTFPCTA